MHDHPTDTAALVERLVKQEFHPLRTKVPKSDPFIEGYRAALIKRLENRDLPAPYRAGTADFDAYLAGKDEGRCATLPTDLSAHKNGVAQA